MSIAFKIIISALLIVHGLIHFMGYVKGRWPEKIPALKQETTKFAAYLWFLCAWIFLAAALLYILKKDIWWIPAVSATLLSQGLIFTVWSDGKKGTLPNIILFLVGMAAGTSYLFETKFKKDADTLIRKSEDITEQILTEDDLKGLPPAVIRYIRYSGAVGKPKVRNMCVIMEGEMRSKSRDWFPFTSVQYSFFREPARLFFMKGRMFGVQVPGYHRYMEGHADMDIRLFGLFPLVKENGPVMDKSETVTWLNDLVIMAPGALTDERITWEYTESDTVKAIFSHNNQSVSALLMFDRDGRLINFLSNDRTDITIRKEIPFSTPIRQYQTENGGKRISEGDAIRHYGEGDTFIYGKFRIKEIRYNVSSRK